MSAMDDAFALIVGITDYLHVTRLPAAVRNDARAIRDLLVDPRYCGYSSGHVTTLLDGEATREAIMRVGFELLPGPVPPDDGPGGGTFDIVSELDIGFRLARFQRAGRTNVAVTVEATTGQGVFFHVGPNLDHHWHARGNRSFTATVRPTSGSGTIRNPVKFVALGRDGQLTAREVFVQGNPPLGPGLPFLRTFLGS